MSAWFRARDRKSPEPPAEQKPGAAARLLTGIIERGSRAQVPAVQNYVDRLRAKYPDATPTGIVTKLEKRYLATVMTSGAAVGSTAAVPGLGTFAALSAVTGETAVFLEATAVFVLATATVHGIPLEERERRRTLVLAVLVGKDSKGAVTDLLGRGRTGGAWISEGAATLPLPALTKLNARLLRYFVKRYTLRRGALAFGKVLPVGVGAVVGGVGNRMMGRKIVANARMAFGAAPPQWPTVLRLVPPLPKSASGQD